MPTCRSKVAVGRMENPKALPVDRVASSPCRLGINQPSDKYSEGCQSNPKSALQPVELPSISWRTPLRPA